MPRPLVMVIDDDASIVDGLVSLLELSGCGVCAGLDGAEGLGHIENGVCPDIMVLDYRLPGKNGLDVVRRARQLLGGELPAVLLTGDTSAQEVKNAGVKDVTVLHKPVDFDALLALIHSRAK